MSDLKRELERLRQRLAEIDQKYEGKYEETHAGTPVNSGDRDPRAFAMPGAAGVPPKLPGIPEDFDPQAAVEDWLGAEEVQTEYGCHLESETHYPASSQHGSADVGALAEMPPDLLGAITGSAAPESPPSDWAFLDTETTGISARMDTCAFLVGVGRITQEGFTVRQFFMRSYDEEASLLDAVARYLAPFRVLITYNGRAFDQPLLESRALVNNAPLPFDRMEHLDLLHGARRLWKLRYQSCRLVDLERQVLGFEREGDVPGDLIPYIYFEYLRTQLAARLLPVFHHNALDILTLACLTAIVPEAFRCLEPGARGGSPSVRRGLGRHAAEMVGLGRWLRGAGELEQAAVLFEEAIDAGLGEELLYPTLWDLAALERKRDRVERALELWEELSTAPSAFRVKAIVERAKHYEHRAKDPERALELTREAFLHPVSGRDVVELKQREQRLEKRLEKRAEKQDAAKAREKRGRSAAATR